MKNRSILIDPPHSEHEMLSSFREHLHTRGYAEVIVRRYERFVRRVARWLRQRDRRLLDLDVSEVPRLLGRILRGRRMSTVSQCRCPLERWFEFRGQNPRHAGDRRPPWQQWCDAYRSFLTDHRGLQSDSVDDNLREARLLLEALFGRHAARWEAIKVPRVWRYCERCAHGAKPGYINKRLFAVRRFLQFVHARDGCPAELSHAVPHVASFVVASLPPAALTDVERQQLLRSFPVGAPGGRRDLAMCRCMLDLGMRSVEVARLRQSDVDWSRRRLTVPAVKRGRERHMPVPGDLAAALRDYFEHDRPRCASDSFFVRTHTRIGQPITAVAVQAAMVRAYHRAGLPRAWHGSHRLRHTFATRLFARGATLKEIADLLGHRRLDSANLYTRVDLNLLRRVAWPWPV
jgi:site-specific recombinase XerD